jgi:hypothetical protein
MCVTPGRINALDWHGVEAALGATGFAIIRGVLGSRECAELTGMYSDRQRFRSRVVMSRHGFGRGEYQYFADPLPATVSALREHVYSRLVPVANAWRSALGDSERFPPTLSEFRKRCHAGGQCWPTPLLLKYATGDYNCLHQDIYGPLVFPIQLAVLLSQPEQDFVGGEFVLTEQRPRLQSRVQVVPLKRGDGVLFAVNFRPFQGTRSTCRARVRHGVSPLRSGNRFTLGVIFHDAA